MRRIVLIAACIGVSVVLGRTQEESFRYVDGLMDLIATSPEWEDCVEEGSTNEYEVAFPTMERSFEYEMPSNMCGHGWSLQEKRDSFHAFLQSLSQTNSVTVSEQYRRTGDLALICCLEKGYTNALIYAKEIVRSEGAPCKNAGLALLLKFSEPTVEMNSLVLAVQTNTQEFTVFERGRVIADYAKVLCDLSENRVVVTNAACEFFRSRLGIEHCLALDGLLGSAFPDYVVSSNRLAFARTSLGGADGNAFLSASVVRQYFIPITNLLLNAAQPLPEVEALRGL